MKDSDWEILYELKKTPNLTKLANVLFTTQSALTKRIQHIEAELDVSIIERTKKGIIVTPEGNYLAEQAEILLRFIKATKMHLENLRLHDEGQIKVASAYTFSKFSLIDLMMPYQIQHPGVEFNVQNESSDLLFRRMLEGNIDVGFIHGDYDGPVHKTLFGRSPAYLVTKEPVENFEDILAMKRLNFSTNMKSLSILNDWWQDRFGEEPHLGPVMGYVDVILQMVQKGLGYTLCFLPDGYPNPYGLCLKPLEFKDGRGAYRNIWFVYSKDKIQNHIVTDFIKYVEDEIERRKQNAGI